MEEHPYPTRSKHVCKEALIPGNNYLTPKYVVNLSGVKTITRNPENYSIMIESLVSMSNKLLLKNRLNGTNALLNQPTETSDDDSDWEPDKKPPSKYIKYSKAENAYFKKLSLGDQKAIILQEKAIKNFQSMKKPIRFKILELESLSDQSKLNIVEKLEQFKKLDSADNEFFKLSNWINWLDKVPFNKFSKLNVNVENPESITKFLTNAKSVMDGAVFGHREAKDQIIINLAKMITNDISKGTCIAIQGPMGNGKTTLVKEGICKALGRPFGFIALGGMQDSNFMLGHDYTYEGSKPGRIVEILAESNCMNPVFFFDELDKISTTSHGDEISNLLCHLTDFAQNSEFQDKYLSGVKIDLSRAIFIFSYNDPDKINPILLDRMHKITTKGFKTEDKLKIAENYLIPDILKEYGLSDISFTEDCIRDIIANYADAEKGVRNLRRNLETVISKINVISLLKTTTTLIECGIKNITFPFIVTRDILSKFIKDQKADEPIFGLYT